MSRQRSRCDEIVALIDRCLADVEASTRPASDAGRQHTGTVDR